MTNKFIATLPQWQMLQPFALPGIYLSGPISADPDTAPERFQKARDFMVQVFGPDQAIATPIGIDVDNAQIPQGITNPARYSHPLYMIECYKFLMYCKCIVLLPGWERSKGAVYEARFAESLGIVPLFLSPLIDGGLLLDLTDTFVALQSAEWVDSEIAEWVDSGIAETGFDGFYLKAAKPTEFHDSTGPVSVVSVGGDPNPFNVAVDDVTAQAIADRAAMFESALPGCGVLPHDPEAV